LAESHVGQSTNVTGMAHQRPSIGKPSLLGSFNDACPKQHSPIRSGQVVPTISAWSASRRPDTDRFNHSPGWGVTDGGTAAAQQRPARARGVLLVRLSVPELLLNSARENINACHSPPWQSSSSFRRVIELNLQWLSRKHSQTTLLWSCSNLEVTPASPRLSGLCASDACHSCGSF
jgi:hypothetical protein